MNLVKTSKRSDTWLAGLAAILLVGAAAAGIWLFSQWATSWAGDGAAGQKDRYYVYGRTFTSVGDRWVFLGAYDDVYEAAKVAAAAKAGKDGSRCCDSKILSASRLALPPAEDRIVYRLDRGSGKAWTNAGTYRTPEQAAAAAEKIVADGEKFEVTYDRSFN